MNKFYPVFAGILIVSVLATYTITSFLNADSDYLAKEMEYRQNEIYLQEGMTLTILEGEMPDQINIVTEKDLEDVYAIKQMIKTLLNPEIIMEEDSDIFKYFGRVEEMYIGGHIAYRLDSGKLYVSVVNTHPMMDSYKLWAVEHAWGGTFRYDGHDFKIAFWIVNESTNL